MRCLQRNVLSCLVAYALRKGVGVILEIPPTPTSTGF